MRNLCVALVVSAGCLCASAQQGAEVSQANIAELLHFEGPLSAQGLPKGWYSPGPPEVALDAVVLQNGKPSVKIERTSASSNGFTPISVALPVDFTGHNVELRGDLRVSGVNGYTALWLRADSSDGAVVGFQNSAASNFHGTSDWQPFSVSIPLSDEAHRLVFGVLLSGTGTAWAGNLELLVDGRPVSEAALRPTPQPTALDRDTEFAAGSGIHLKMLSDRQVENLATLAEVWGFLKYHHPAVTAGEHNWDFDLFRVMPKVLAARTSQQRNAVLLAWIESFGPVAKCSPCTQLQPAPQLAPDIAWISDRRRFGPALTAKLEAIYASRPNGASFFLDAAPYTNNPMFLHEPGYPKIAFPDAGYQLLTLFRWWNAIEWWYPDRAQLLDLHRTLRGYVRPMALAKTKDTFTLATMKLIGEAHDTHANLWSSLGVRPPTGSCSVPASLRHLGSDFVVWDATDEAAGLRRGDVIESLDGRATSGLAAEWAPFYDASNVAAGWRDLSRQLTRGACGPVVLGVRREGHTLQVNSARVSSQRDARGWHDHGGEVFRLLSKDVAYIDLGSSKIADIPDYIQRAQGTRGMVLDLRDYPAQFMVFALGQLLIEKPTVFVRLTALDLANPGAFRFVPDPTLQPQTPHYSGRIVILVDEVSQSQAEYTAMALRAAPGAIVVGNQTAGADGNVSNIPLPFGMSTMISGLGVFTPQGVSTQQVGIARDVEAVPTVAGIAAGRDEVLEVGIRQILGQQASEADIQAMAWR
jgi:C-terminal processing protease CtpA/Prc